MAKLNELQAMIGKWADATFPDRNQTSIIAHLRDEITNELHPGCDPLELADVAMLIIDLAHYRRLLLTDILECYSDMTPEGYKFEENDRLRVPEQSIIHSLKLWITRKIYHGCDPFELANMLRLVIRLAWHRKLSLSDLIEQKHQINLSRTWNEPNEQGFRTHVKEKTMTDFEIFQDLLQLPVHYDPEGTLIMDASNYHVLDIRGWGRLMYMDNPEEKQDAIGRHIADALNNYVPKVVNEVASDQLKEDELPIFPIDPARKWVGDLDILLSEVESEMSLEIGKSWEILIFNGDPAVCYGINRYGDYILFIEWFYYPEDTEVIERGLYLLVTEQEINEFIAGNRSLHEMIVCAKALYVKDDLGNQNFNWYRITAADIPVEYWPPEDSFLHEENGVKTLKLFH